MSECTIECDDKNKRKYHCQVLVVENDDSIRELIKEFVKEGDYSVDVASNAKEACELISETEYEVIILDIKLNGTNGVELCIKIRDFDEDVVILAITGLTVLTDEYDLKIAGFDEVFTKPWSYHDLLDTMKRYLD